MSMSISQREFTKSSISIIENFVEGVNRLAEDKMLKTGKLEGSHKAAMDEMLHGLKEKYKEDFGG